MFELLPFVETFLQLPLAEAATAVAEGAAEADGHGVASSEGFAGAAIALIALSTMEIVLGIDNIVFISIVTGRLPAEQQKKARLLGLGLAMGMRIALLGAIFWVMKLVHPIFSLDTFLPPLSSWLVAHPEINEVSWKDLILLGGGLFLIYKSVKEIDHQMDAHDEHLNVKAKPASFRSVIIQILLLDIIFSLDSVITAVGMADQIWVMITAVVIAVGIMMAFAGPVARFVEANPTVKMLALSFLLMIGVMLVAEGSGTHIAKGYIYFAMAFSLLVEVLNLRSRAKAARARSHTTTAPDSMALAATKTEVVSGGHAM